MKARHIFLICLTFLWLTSISGIYTVSKKYAQNEDANTDNYDEVKYASHNKLKPINDDSSTIKVKAE